jgi:two-component system, LuxR family, response regulator FixJ
MVAMMSTETEDAPATVHVIDDDDAVRKSIGWLLQMNGYQTRTYACGPDFLADYEASADSCAIVDLRMRGGMDGLQLQAAIQERGLRLPLVFLSGHGDIPSAVRALKAGAIDFLTKPVQGDTLLASVRTALAMGRSSPPSPLDRLSERERQVLRLALEGWTNKEIAREFAISHRTVELHRAHAMQKTGARNLLELAHRIQGQGDAGVTSGSLPSQAPHTPVDPPII